MDFMYEDILRKACFQEEDLEHSPHPDCAMEDYDDVALPSIQDGWESWTKAAFENGNSQVFLKLATWMLIRFRQLANINIEDSIEGVIIPENPRVMDGLNDDHFFEALGMERMYTAIVHMETSPRYMCHIFHALGKVMATSDVGTSHPRFWPCNSPPAVDAR
jgi:hypothetical protein